MVCANYGPCFFPSQLPVPLLTTFVQEIRDREAFVFRCINCRMHITPVRASIDGDSADADYGQCLDGGLCPPRIPPQTPSHLISHADLQHPSPDGASTQVDNGRNGGALRVIYCDEYADIVLCRWSGGRFGASRRYGQRRRRGGDDIRSTPSGLCARVDPRRGIWRGSHRVFGFI